MLWGAGFGARPLLLFLCVSPRGTLGLPEAQPDPLVHSKLAAVGGESRDVLRTQSLPNLVHGDDAAVSPQRRGVTCRPSLPTPCTRSLPPLPVSLPGPQPFFKRHIPARPRIRGGHLAAVLHNCEYKTEYFRP